MTHAQPMDIHRPGAALHPLMANAVVKGTRLAAVGPIRYDSLENTRQYPKALYKPRGSAPLPANFKGMRHNPQVLINKLGQRLAFERAGVRLYEALIIKCEAAQQKGAHSILSIKKLKQFRDEELAHFLLLRKAMTSIGADPAAMTPTADTGALSSLGVQQVLSEPRTSVLQCLEAILTTELTDNAAWGLLKELCLNMGLTDLADEFSQALAQEEVHAEIIAEWVRLMTLTQRSPRHRKTAHS